MNTPPSIFGHGPSAAELLERAREKVRRGLYVAWPSVNEMIQRLKAAKKQGQDEDEDFEYITISFVDLAKAIKDPSSKITDVGEDDKAWSLTIVGVDQIGNLLTVYVRLSKNDADPLQITLFLASVP